MADEKYILHVGWEFPVEELKEGLKDVLNEELIDALQSRISFATHYFADHSQNMMQSAYDQFSKAPKTATIKGVAFYRHTKRKRFLNWVIVAQVYIDGREYDVVFNSHEKPMFTRKHYHEHDPVRVECNFQVPLSAYVKRQVTHPTVTKHIHGYHMYDTETVKYMK